MCVLGQGDTAKEGRKAKGATAVVKACMTLKVSPSLGLIKLVKGKCNTFMSITVLEMHLAKMDRSLSSLGENDPPIDQIRLPRHIIRISTPEETHQLRHVLRRARALERNQLAAVLRDRVAFPCAGFLAQFFVDEVPHCGADDAGGVGVGWREDIR